jgi:hypothetical protein
MCFKKSLPYPMEPEDPLKKASTIIIENVVTLWLDNYNVPFDYRIYWRNEIEIKVYDFWPQEILNNHTEINIKTPGFMFDKVLYCLARWFNPGVIAHEQAHNSYTLLHEKEDWIVAYKAEATGNKPLQQVFKEHPYACVNDIEAHAEIYRYLGPKMPDNLKIYYPKLF